MTMPQCHQQQHQQHPEEEEEVMPEHDETTIPKREQRQLHVSFDMIEIHEHTYELGDNPSVSEGAPVTISWAPQRSNSFTVEYYESYKPSEHRRQKETLKLSTSDRTLLLVSSGYKLDEIVESTLQTWSDRRSRTESVRNRKWDGFHDFIETTARPFKWMSGKRRTKRRATMAVSHVREDPELIHNNRPPRRHSLIGGVTHHEPPPLQREASLSRIRSGRRASLATSHAGLVVQENITGPQFHHPITTRETRVSSRSGRRASLGSTATHQAEETPKYESRRRHSLLGGHELSQSREPTTTVTRRNSLFGGQHRAHNNTEHISKRRNSLSSAQHEQTYCHAHNEPVPRRNSMFGTTKQKHELTCHDNHPVARRNSMFGSTMKQTKSNQPATITKRRNSFFGGWNEQPFTVKNDQQPVPRRRNSMFGNHHQQPIPLQHLHSQTVTHVSSLPSTRRHFLLGSHDPMFREKGIDSVACAQRRNSNFGGLGMQPVSEGAPSA